MFGSKKIIFLDFLAVSVLFIASKKPKTIVRNLKTKMDMKFMRKFLHQRSSGEDDNHYAPSPPIWTHTSLLQSLQYYK